MSVGTGGCGAEYERAGGRLRGDRVVRCNLPFGHVGDHEERDDNGEVISSWQRQYRPGKSRQVPGLAIEPDASTPPTAPVDVLVEGLNREIAALSAEVAALKADRQPPAAPPAGTRIPPLPRWLIDAAGHTDDPGLALGFAGSAWVTAWANRPTWPAAAATGGDG